MTDKLTEADWNFLLWRIDNESCTPFLGPGAHQDFIPFSSGVAQEWSQDPEFPFTELNNLPLAAQFIDVTVDVTAPRPMFAKKLEGLVAPDFTDRDEPHIALAGLPFPIYVTTNFDDFMLQALVKQRKDPRREMCRWNKYIQMEGQPLFETGYMPSVSSPVVYHLFGYSHRQVEDRRIPIPESLVLTEDDHLDFLVNTSKDRDLIPPRIQRAFTNTTLLLLGYRLDDWGFRVLFRSIVSYLNLNPTNTHVAVQLVPVRDEAPDEQKRKAQKYFDRYLSRSKIRVHWGTCHDFVAELRKRWKDSGHV